MSLLHVIVPVYNEEKTLLNVMKKLEKTLPNANIIYVNDGSNDASLEILQKNARPQDIVLTKENGGKGSALRLGIASATAEYCVIQDADLEYNPEDIVLLLEKAEANLGSIIFGSRFLKTNPTMYPLFLLGNKILTWFLNMLFWSNISDSYTCYKLFPTKILQSIPLQGDGFEIEAELCAYPLKLKKKIIEIPITYAPRSFEEGKKIRAKDALKGILTMIKIRFK